MSLKNSIRELALGKHAFRSKEITYKGQRVGFQEMSLKERKQVISRSRDADGTLDDTKLVVNAIIAMTVDPDTGDKVFSSGDFEAIMSSPSGGYIEAFSKPVFELFSPEDEDVEGEVGNEPAEA